MIILGVVLLLIGYCTGLSLLYTIGGILVVVGVVLWLLGAVGRPVVGRRAWYQPSAVRREGTKNAAAKRVRRWCGPRNRLRPSRCWVRWRMARQRATPAGASVDP